MTSEQFPIENDQDLNRLRERLRAIGSDCGFSDYETTKLVTAASEICRNILDYAGEGIAVIESSTEGETSMVTTTFTDEGPGIEDVDRALEDGFRGETSSGLGIGLPGAKRLSDRFDIESTPGDGTTIELMVRAEQ